MMRHPSSARATCENRTNSHNLWDISAIIRAQRDRDFVAAIAEWQRSSGPDRAYWRRYVRMHIREERASLAKSRAALRTAATQAQARRNAA